VSVPHPHPSLNSFARPSISKGTGCVAAASFSPRIWQSNLLHTLNGEPRQELHVTVAGPRNEAQAEAEPSSG
jgi:hypothetical protein